MDSRLVTAQIEKNMMVLGNGENYMRDAVFSGRRNHVYKFINLAETTMHVRSLPVVAENEPGVPLEHAGSTLDQVKTPKLSVEIPITEITTETPMMAAPSFRAMDTDLNQAQMERIMAEQDVTKRSFATTEEDWCAQIHWDSVQLPSNFHIDTPYHSYYL